MKKNLPFLTTGLSAILFLVNPHGGETKGSLEWCLGVHLPPSCGLSSQQWTLAGPCDDGVWIWQSPSFSWSPSLHLSSSSVVQCATWAKLHK